MEIFMRYIPADYDKYQVKSTLASVLHGPELFNRQVNFEVYIHHSRLEAVDRTGRFTVHDLNIGKRFLEIYGKDNPKSFIDFDDNTIEFSPSKYAPRPDTLHTISLTPWVDPAKEREEENREKGLSWTFVPLQSIQFGWMCRDDVFSIESETHQHAELHFDFQRRELNAIVRGACDRTSECVVAIRPSSVLKILSHPTPDKTAIIFLQLEIPPTFFSRPISTPGEKREGQLRRLVTFPVVNNPLAIPYTSLAIRLVCSAPTGTQVFAKLSEQANLQNFVKPDFVNFARRDLFSRNQLQAMDIGIRQFDWCVAFQLEALVRNMCLDAFEVLELVPKVQYMLKSHGKNYVAALLENFSPVARDFLYTEAISSVSSCFDEFVEKLAKRGDVTLDPLKTDANTYSSLHVTITPTSMFPAGPSVERSNRVIRRYGVANQENFLRVEFRDEDHLQYRFDKEVDGEDFIQKWLKPILHDGLIIAGRRFRFLAYSLSALKEHTVWFVNAFHDPKYGIVTVQRIIESLGSFSDLVYDDRLMYCPARYGARIAQAFSATDVAAVDVDELFIRPDIETKDGYKFTDGSGGMSEDLARAIWQVIRRKEDLDDFPRAYQIRFQGSKGMLSVDYTLNGSNALSLRRSMVKFEAPECGEIEISRAIDRPAPYYLNRPLVMILEGLGVPYQVFQNFQDEAVRKTKEATQNLSAAAHLLRTHGLGLSFQLPSIMLSLAKLNLDALVQDPFFSGPLRLGVYHVLRDLKHRARIPIPDAWTLVGVADTHRYLEENQVFVCIKHPDKGTFFLEGPVLVSRSPTIHPGDVQIAQAIGAPPRGSCFAKEPLPNTIVFSARGARPLPTYLGGGDLDGDTYNIIPLKCHGYFLPEKMHPPAKYSQAARQCIQRPSTMNDVADFFMEYIVSDVLGMIASTWLVIADQEKGNIFHPDCMDLAELHSGAVDYQKTGRRVDINDIPRAMSLRPDWSAPETVESIPNHHHKYYESTTALGKLTRAIDLNALEPSILIRTQPRRRGQIGIGRVENLAGNFSSFDLGDGPTSAILNVVKPLVAKFINLSVRVDRQVSESILSTFTSFSGELERLSSRYSLSHRDTKALSEDELIINTITQKTSQPALRKEKIAKIKDATEREFRNIKDKLKGDPGRPPEEYLKYAWVAWGISSAKMRMGVFGGKAFWWISLGLVFEAIKINEEAEALRHPAES